MEGSPIIGCVKESELFFDHNVFRTYGFGLGTEHACHIMRGGVLSRNGNLSGLAGRRISGLKKDRVPGELDRDLFDV